MFKFGDSVGSKPGEGRPGESVQGAVQGAGGKGGIGAARSTGVIAAGGSGLGPGGSPVLANVSQSMMGSEGGRLGVGRAFGVAGPRVFGGLATPQAMLQNHHNPFDIAAGGGGTGAGGGIGTGGILPGTIADSGAQWGSVGGMQDQQLQQQLLMLQRFQAQQQHLQQQQQHLQGASQQQLRQHSIQPAQQLIAAALPVGAVPPASPSHAQIGFMLPAQMRVHMATAMAELGSAVLDGGANGAPRGNSVGNAGGTVGLAVGAPGELAAATLNDTPSNFSVETPRQQDLQVHTQYQQLQLQQQQHYQQQSTSTSQDGRSDIGHKESDMKIVPAPSPTLGYSPSGWETGVVKLGAQSMDTALLNASRNGNANSSAPEAVSSQTNLDNVGRRSNGGSDGDSVNVRREGVSEAGTKEVIRDSKSGSVGDSGGGGVNNGVESFTTGPQAGMSQMPSNDDRGSGGVGGNGSGTLTADNTLGMAAAVMSFYNELPGSTGGGVNASMARVAQNTTAGAGAPGSGSEGEQSTGQGGGHESGGGSKGTGGSDGTDWQQVVKPGLTSRLPGTVSTGKQVGVLDPQPQQGTDGFGRQDKRVSSGAANSGWALSAPIDGTGLVAAAAAGTVGVGPGGGTGSSVGGMQPAAAGTAGAVGMDVGKQQQAYLQAVFQARMQHQQQQQQQQQHFQQHQQQHFQQHLQQRQFARTPQQSQMMQAQHLATQIQQQFRLQSQQMNALFQAKQMALQQKLRAGQMTLQQAQQVSQMQQVQLARAIQTLYVQAQAHQQQQAAQIFAQQQVHQLQLHNIQQLQMMKFQQQQQARALQLPVLGAPQALQPLAVGQPESQTAHRTSDGNTVLSLSSESSGVGRRGNGTVSIVPQVPSGPATAAGGGDGGSASNIQQAQGTSVVPDASAGAAAPSVVGGGVSSDVIEAGVRPDTLKSNPIVSTPAAAVGADLSSGTQAPQMSPQLPQQATLIQNFDASAAASRVAVAAASKAVAGGAGGSRGGIWSAGGGGIGGPGGGTTMGVNVTALQQQMIMQQQQQQMAAVMAQQQLIRQNQTTGGVAPLFPDNQQQQQQQQQLMMVSNFPGGFAHAGVNPAQSTPSAGGGSAGLNIAGQTIWPAGVGLGAGMNGPPRPPPSPAAAATATSLPFQQRQPTSFSTSTPTPTPTPTPTAVFPSIGVGMLGAVMGGRLGLIGSNPGNNLERKQEVASTAFNLQGVNRIVGGVTDHQQQVQPQTQPQDVHPLQKQNGTNFGREAEKASMGLASSVAMPSSSFVSTGVSVSASGTSDVPATTMDGVPGVEAAAADAAGATSASGPTPRPWNGPVDDEDWGPEGEEEFMSMLNLAMDDEDAEMAQSKGAMAPSLGFLGWDEEEDPHPDEGQDDYDDELLAYKEDPKIALGPGSRVRRKQFVEKLEKAKVEMAADLKARTKEDQLALKLREQWRQKMRDIALAILRRWWSAGDMKKSRSTNGGSKIRGGGGEGSDSVGEESWQDLLTDDAVAVAPVESGRVEISVCSNVTGGGAVGSAATTQAVKEGSAVIPSARVRAKEARLEGLAAVRAEAERLRVMRETLGYPTPLGNLKLKFDVHVSCVTVVRYMVDAGRELGSEEVDVNVMELTSTSFEKVDHWAFGERELMCQWRASTRNAALCGGRWELETRGMMSLYMWTSEDGEAPSVEPKSKASTWAILRSPADRTESPYSQQPSLQQQSTSPLAPSLPDARRDTKAGLAVGASPVVTPVSTVASTWGAAAGTGARRTKVFQESSSVKRSRQDMEAGTATGIPGEASSVAGGSKRACITGSRGSGGGENGIDSNGDARAVEADVKPEEEFPWLNDPRGEGMGAGAAANASVESGVDNDTAKAKRASRKAGSDRSNSPVGGSDSSPNGSSMLLCGRWKPRRSRRDQNGRELGKVVGVPRQAKARDVYILYDHCGFVGELEESFGREIPSVPRTLEQAELPRVRRRLIFPAGSFSRQPKIELEGKKSNGVREEGAATNGGIGAADHPGGEGINASVPASNGCGAATEVKDKRQGEGSDNCEELPCALTSFGSDDIFRVLRMNHALRGITRRRRRRSGGDSGEGDDSLVAEADKGEPSDEKNCNENGDGREEKGGGELGSPPRLHELGKVVWLWKQPGRRKEVRSVEFAVNVDDGGGEERLARHAPAVTASSAVGTVAGGARRGGLVGSSSACRGDDEAQRELFRGVSEALRQGLSLWLPVGIVAVDGREIQGYAAVYPLMSSSAEDVGHPSRTEAYAEMVYGKRETGGEDVSTDTPLQYALWEFHCIEGSVHLCVSRVVDKLMAALFRKMGDVMLEPDYEESLSLMQLNKLVDPEQCGDAETPLGQGGVREEDGRSDGGGVTSGDRWRALLRLKQLWMLYQVCSQKELQLTSSFSLFHKMGRSPPLENRRDSRAARSRGEGSGGGGVKGRFPGRIGVSKGIVGISRNIEEETVRFFMSSLRDAWSMVIRLRQFLLETRRGIVMDLLFHILKGCENDPDLGRIVEELVWSSWAVHGDEEVVRLMAEAKKLTNAGKFDRSNAALEKVLKIDENHADAYNRRATNLMLKGRMQEAADDIQKVLAIEPRHFGALKGLGVLRMKLKDYSGALVAFELVVKINPMMLPGLRDNVTVCHAAGNAMLS